MGNSIKNTNKIDNTNKIKNTNKINNTNTTKVARYQLFPLPFSGLVKSPPSALRPGGKC